MPLRGPRVRTTDDQEVRLGSYEMDINPSAARSLGEGLEETLTMHRLHIPPQLRKTLASTNVIESAFSIRRTGLLERETLACRRSA